MKLKTFAIKEVNMLLPKIKAIFDDISLLKKKISLMSSETAWIKNFWGNDLYDSDNPDAEKYGMLSKETEQHRSELTKKIGQIEGFGCVVKNIDIGLVDFYSYLGSELIFLCWQYGEKEIKYWHTIEGGFSGRKTFANIDKVE